jgi:hypothetical protein
VSIASLEPRRLALAALVLLLSGCAGVRPELQPPPPDMLQKLEALSPHTCNPTVASALASLNVPASAVQSLQYTVRTAGTGVSEHIVSLDVYVGLVNDVRGVVRVRPDCELITVFER